MKFSFSHSKSFEWYSWCSWRYVSSMEISIFGYAHSTANNWVRISYFDRNISVFIIIYENMSMEPCIVIHQWWFNRGKFAIWSATAIFFFWNKIGANARRYFMCDIYLMMVGGDETNQIGQIREQLIHDVWAMATKIMMIISAKYTWIYAPLLSSRAGRRGDTLSNNCFANHHHHHQHYRLWFQKMKWEFCVNKNRFASRIHGSMHLFFVFCWLFAEICSQLGNHTHSHILSYMCMGVGGGGGERN